MKIGAIFHPRTVNAQYRVLIPMAALSEAGHEVCRFPQEYGGPALPFEQVASCDVVHIHRFVPDGDDSFVDRLRERGVAVTFDNDDDVGAAPAGVLEIVQGVTDTGYVANALQAFSRTLRSAARADLVIVPSEALGLRHRAAGAEQVRVIENHLPDRFLDVAELPRRQVTIGWHGCAEHGNDYATLGLRAVLAELLDRHQQLQVRSVLLDLDLDDDRYRRIGWVQFEHLTKRLAHFDIGIAPVLDNAFNRARSNVKVREYAAAGVPWLASPVGPYLGLGAREGGRLIPDDGWFEALDQLVRSSSQRQEMAQAARAWAERETITRNVHLWEDAFQTALRAAGSAEPAVNGSAPPPSR